MAVILIVRVSPTAASRPKTISIPECVRRKVWAAAQPASEVCDGILWPSPERFPTIGFAPQHWRRPAERSERALPAHCARLGHNLTHTAPPLGSASTMISIASRRLFEISGFKALPHPDGQLKRKREVSESPWAVCSPCEALAGDLPLAKRSIPSSRSPASISLARISRPPFGLLPVQSVSENDAV